jgi:hypothetical protein
MTLVWLTLACAPESPDTVEDTIAGLGGTDIPLFIAELDGYDPAFDGPLVAELVEQVPGTPPTYLAPIADVHPDLAGIMTFELPTADDDVDVMRFRVAVREERAGGVKGPIRGMFAPTIVWQREASESGAPEGWSVETRRRGETAWEPMDRGSIPLSLAPEPERTLTGPFDVTGLDPMASVGVALMHDGDVVPGIFGMAVGGIWAIHLDGEPSGFAGARLRPVAWVEADGVLGFDPETEEIIAQACATGQAGFARWMSEPRSITAADVLVLARATPGWNAWRGEGLRGRALGEDMSFYMAETCE